MNPDAFLALFGMLLMLALLVVVLRCKIAAPRRGRKAWKHYGALPLVLACALFGTGCTNTAAIVRAMGESNASLSAEVQTPWGRARVVRTNPGDVTPPHAIGPDGTVQVGKPQ